MRWGMHCRATGSPALRNTAFPYPRGWRKKSLPVPANGAA